MKEIKFTAIFSNGGEILDFGFTLDGKPAETNALVEAFTFLGIVNQDFADAISDTFDNILAAQVEMDELINDPIGEFRHSVAAKIADAIDNNIMDELLNDEL